ncbi:MAG: hypothetical protein ACYSUX_18310 [Planctomycetota bacterium]|jgi:hypothetical protein
MGDYAEMSLDNEMNEYLDEADNEHFDDGCPCCGRPFEHCVCDDK